MKVSKVQQKLNALVKVLKRIRQPSVKGLNFTLTEYGEGVEIYFHYGKKKDVWGMRIRKSGRRLVCESTMLTDWDPQDHVMACKVFKQVGKFHRIWKEFA